MDKIKNLTIEEKQKMIFKIFGKIPVLHFLHSEYMINTSDEL